MAEMAQAQAADAEKRKAEIVNKLEGLVLEKGLDGAHKVLETQLKKEMKACHQGIADGQEARLLSESGLPVAPDKDLKKTNPQAYAQQDAVYDDARKHQKEHYKSIHRQAEAEATIQCAERERDARAGYETALAQAEKNLRNK